MSGRIESSIIKPDGAACKPLGTDRFTDPSVTDSLTLTSSHATVYKSSGTGSSSRYLLPFFIPSKL